MKNFDDLYIGSNGFAQVGDPDYHSKQQAERLVIFELLSEKEELKIPEEFQWCVKYQWKAQQHDFGMYHDLVIYYNRNYIDNLECSNEIADQEKHDRFWNWANGVESFDFETEEITERCETKYYEMFPDKQVKIIYLKQA